MFYFFQLAKKRLTYEVITEGIQILAKPNFFLGQNKHDRLKLNDNYDVVFQFDNEDKLFIVC